MISILRSLAVAAVAMFAAGSAQALPVYDCDPANEEAISQGVKFLQDNWTEFKKRIQDGGVEVANCMEDKVLSTGTVSCDMYECPMPGLVGWTRKGINDVYFCPWYYEERIDHLKKTEEKAACFGGNTASMFAISCRDIGEDHWDYYDAILVDMMVEKNPNLRVDGMLDCGNNQQAPFTIKGTNGKIFK